VTGDVSAADIDNLAELLKGRRFIESLREHTLVQNWLEGLFPFFGAV